MSPLRIVNAALYADRTVQHWHRDSLPSDHSAIDLDLMGACRYCSQPLYLIEATTNPQKATTMLRCLAERADVPAFVILHDTEVVTGGRMIWPSRRQYASELMIRLALIIVRMHHYGDVHPHKLQQHQTERKSS